MYIGIEATSAAAAHKAGVGHYTYYLIQALARLSETPHHYTLYLRAPWVETASSEAIDFQRHPNLASNVLPFPYLWAQIRLPIELWRHRQDVYFFPSSVIPLAYQPSNSVVTIHDVAFLFFPDCFTPLLRTWLKIATELGMSRAKKIIAVSEATRQDVLAYYGVPPEKVVVIHHGVHAMYHPFPPAERETVAAIMQKYQIDGAYLLCIGTLQRRKNIPRLLQAFYLLKQKHAIPHKLVLVGQKFADLPEHEIFGMIERLSLREDVICTGYVVEQDLPALLNGAELFVLPSLYEGFGMPLLEAMACGVPVACSNTASFPEVVGDCGVKFDPYNVDDLVTTIYRCLMNDSLRNALSAKGLQRASRFTWEACARKTLEVLESVGSSFQHHAPILV